MEYWVVDPSVFSVQGLNARSFPSFLAYSESRKIQAQEDEKSKNAEENYLTFASKLHFKELDGIRRNDFV